MATSVNSNDIRSKLGNFSNLNPRDLEESLSAFAKRFPVSGQIVHAIGQEFGGVIGLAEHLEKNDLWDDAEQWMATGKPVALPPETVRKLFDDEILDGVARHLGVPIESVETQAALGIPKFFTILAKDETLDIDLSHVVRRSPARTSRGNQVPPP